MISPYTPEALRLVWLASRPAATVEACLMLVAAVLPAWQAFTGKLIIDAVVNASCQGVEQAAH